jgi:hypothetical protein
MCFKEKSNIMERIMSQDALSKAYFKDATNMDSTRSDIIQQDTLGKAEVKDDHCTVANTDSSSFESGVTGTRSDPAHSLSSTDSAGIHEGCDAKETTSLEVDQSHSNNAIAVIDELRVTKFTTTQRNDIDPCIADNEKINTDEAKEDALKDVKVTGELSRKQPNFNIPDFFPVHQVVHPIPMIVFKRSEASHARKPAREDRKSFPSANTIMSDLTSVYKRRKQRKVAPRPTRKGKIAKKMSSNSSRKSANASISRQLGGRRMKKSSNQPIHIRLYEAAKRQQSAVPVLRKKTKALLHDSVHLRLYNQSKKLQSAVKKGPKKEIGRPVSRKQNTRAPPPNSAHLRLYNQSKKLQDKAKTGPGKESAERVSRKNKTKASPSPNSAHLRLYNQSKKLQEEGKRRRQLNKDQDSQHKALVQKDAVKQLLRNVNKQSGQRKKTTSDPNETHLRLYNYATKSQIYSLKTLEEGLTDTSKDLQPCRTNIGPSPTQLRLYEQSKKLQQEGKQRRNNAVNKVGNNPRLIGGPIPTQIRLYNKSKHLQEEGKRRRTRPEEKIKASNTGMNGANALCPCPFDWALPCPTLPSL